MLLPPPLQKKDKLIAIAPCGTLRDNELTNFYEAIEIWREQDYVVEIDSNYRAQEGYLAGKDSIRRKSLKKAWINPEYKAILCIRGGYGGARLLENWQWQSLEYPKWLIGFSDVTSLLWSLYQQKIIGLHAPVLTTIAHEPEWSLNRLFSYLQGKPLPPLKGHGWGLGKARGRLLVGNLTVATTLLGTPICPSFENIILALEDVGETPYKLDRMLTQWRLMGIFEKVKGIALGRFSRCDAPNGIPSWSAQQVFQERLSELNIPIVSDLPFGHDGVNACLPVGEMVEIDGTSGIISFN